MSIQFVNLELWFVNSDKQFTTEQMYGFALHQAKINVDRALTLGATKIALLHIHDGFLHNNNQQYNGILTQIKEYCYSKSIQHLYLLIGMAEDNTSCLNLDGFEVISYCNMANMAEVAYAGIQTEWNTSANKFLFLTGKPSRYNRIVLLYKLFKAGLLKDCEWTFFKPLTDDAWCRNALALSEEDYDTFVHQCERTIDEKYSQGRAYTYVNGKQALEQQIFESDLSKNFMYIDPSVFQNTCFSIISEGVYDDGNVYSKFLSEKTYRTIINKHPFIFAANPEMFVYLKAQGYKTFEQYMTIRDYALIENVNDRLDAIVINAKDFLKTIQQNQKYIKADVDYNFNLLITKVNECKKIQKYLIDNGANLADVDYWLNSLGPHRFIQIYEVENENS